MEDQRACLTVLSAAGYDRRVLQTDPVATARSLVGDNVGAVAHAVTDPWTRDGGRVLAPDDPEWPAMLETLGPGAPLLLWAKGRFPSESTVAVVGSRRCTSYGRQVTEEMAGAIVADGRSVVSGGAIGIDGAGHRAALRARGRTVVILAGGAGTVYPREHSELFRDASRTGVVVWEFPPTAALRKESFLIRNRLIAAMGEATVVVEAAERSGALNTGRCAADLGRLVLAVPGPVNSTASTGTNRAIADGWAAILLGGGDLVQLLPPLTGRV